MNTNNIDPNSLDDLGNDIKKALQDQNIRANDTTLSNADRNVGDPGIGTGRLS